MGRQHLINSLKVITMLENKQIEIATRADDTFSNFLDIQDDVNIKAKVRGKFFLIKYSHDENREENLALVQKSIALKSI